MGSIGRGEKKHTYVFLALKYFLKEFKPGWYGSVIEHPPRNQEVKVKFLVTALNLQGLFLGFHFPLAMLTTVKMGEDTQWVLSMTAHGKHSNLLPFLKNSSFILGTVYFISYIYKALNSNTDLMPSEYLSNKLACKFWSKRCFSLYMQIYIATTFTFNVQTYLF